MQVRSACRLAYDHISIVIAEELGTAYFQPLSVGYARSSGDVHVMRLGQIAFQAGCWSAIPLVQESCPRLAVTVLCVIANPVSLCRIVFFPLALVTNHHIGTVKSVEIQMESIDIES